MVNLLEDTASLTYDALNNSIDYESLLCLRRTHGVSDDYTENSYNRRFEEKKINTNIVVSTNLIP